MSTLKRITSEFNESNTVVSQTRRRLKELGYQSRIPSRKPLISEVNRSKRRSSKKEFLLPTGQCTSSHFCQDKILAKSEKYSTSLLATIEHLWEVMQKQIHSRNPLPKNIPELKVALLEEWQRIPQETLENLVNSVPRRLEALKMANGRNTKY